MMMDKRTRAALVALIVVIPCLTVYAFKRSTALQQQHARGNGVSGNPAETHITAETVLSVGELFITYQSSAQDSAIWVARPSGSLVSWFFPPSQAPFDFEALIRWKDSGRVVWSNTGAASADLLIELAPETNHRLVIVRVTCERGQCVATARERGLIAATRLTVADDGAAILLNDTSMTRYSTIADLMNVAGETTLPRLTAAQADEVVAPSLNASLLLANPQSLTGEALKGPEHFKVHLRVEPGGTPAAAILGTDLEMVIDDAENTRFWDCPSNIFDAATDCTVYTAPSALPRTLPVSLSDTECGIVVSRGGWTWLLRRIAKSQDVFPAEGVASCPNGEIAAYAGGHISYIIPKRDPVTKAQARASLDRVE
jgi:hypothetical protein